MKTAIPSPGHVSVGRFGDDHSDIAALAYFESAPDSTARVLWLAGFPLCPLLALVLSPNSLQWRR